MKNEYYQLCGWDVPSDLPTKAQLEKLKLGDVASDLAKYLTPSGSLLR